MKVLRNTRFSGIALALALLLAHGAGAQTGSGDLRIEDVRVSVLESFPIQVALLVRGQLASACFDVEAHTAVADRPGRIDISLTARAAPGARCAGPEAQFRKRVPIPLDGLPEGRYRLWLNNQEVGDFWYPSGAQPRAGEAMRIEPNLENIDVDAFVSRAERADCARDVNMLYVIKERYVLWARAESNCADNGYAVRLYDRDPATQICHHLDTIAGPMTGCTDAELEPVFREAIRRVGEPDLGLGRGRAKRIWIGFPGQAWAPRAAVGTHHKFLSRIHGAPRSPPGDVAHAARMTRAASVAD